MSEALTALVAYHASGGHEGDGSDETLALAQAELAALSGTADHAGLVEAALKSASEALADHACHNPDAPCRRSKIECDTDCGFAAGNALAEVNAALTALRNPKP